MRPCRFLDESIGAERFRSDGEEPDQERLAEMEMLRQYLEEMCEAIDKKARACCMTARRCSLSLGCCLMPMLGIVVSLFRSTSASVVHNQPGERLCMCNTKKCSITRRHHTVCWHCRPQVKSTSTAADRLRALLASKEKKELILKMAGDNEIDQAFMDLLQARLLWFWGGSR